LFWKKNKFESRTGRIGSLIGPDTVMKGDVDFIGDLRVEGAVRGDVSVSLDGSGVLMLGENGIVNGNVRVTHLVVYGSITGSVYVTDLVELRSSAVISGDVYYGTMEMQMGAVIEGNLVHLEALSKSSEPELSALTDSGYLVIKGPS
jgi:cytoskeletal protein CcmA (bactofilin family)